MRRTVLTFSLMLTLAGGAYGQSVTASVGACTISTSEDVLRQTDRGSVEAHVLSWTSGSGTVTAVLSGINAELLRASYNPGAASPTASYDITLKDADGYDALRGSGANLSATANSEAWIADSTSGYFGFPIAGNFTLSVTNAGTSKAGTILLYTRR